MAVYTPVDSDEVRAFLRAYDVGAYQRHDGIVQGVENTNYHLFTDRGRYILTIFEKRIDPADLPFVFSFTHHLAGAGIPVPDVVPARDGQGIGTLAGKPAALIRFLAGRDVPDAAITPAHCAQTAAVLARMHRASESFSPGRANPVGPAQWRTLWDAARLHADAELAALVDAALAAPPLPAVLTRGAVHADLFPDNVFFDDAGTLSGVIDFYFSCTETYVYDLAMTVNAWCFTTGGALVPERLTAFAHAYETVRPLTPAERAAFPAARRAAALRILMTRFYDWAFTPAGASVVRKDPREYQLKLKAECEWL